MNEFWQAFLAARGRGPQHNVLEIHSMPSGATGKFDFIVVPRLFVDGHIGATEWVCREMAHRTNDGARLYGAYGHSEPTPAQIEEQSTYWAWRPRLVADANHPDGLNVYEFTQEPRAPGHPHL